MRIIPRIIIAREVAVVDTDPPGASQLLTTRDRELEKGNRLLEL